MTEPERKSNRPGRPDSGPLAAPRRIWRELPDSLRVMLGAFLFIPPWGLGWLGAPELLVEEYGWGGALLALTMLVVIPIGLAMSVIYRHRGFLLLFGLECVALWIQPFVLQPGEHALFRGMRLSLAAVVMLLGLFIVRRDFLFPLLSGDGRLWRKARRFQNNLLVRISPGGGGGAPAVVENLSATGMALSVDARTPPQGVRAGTDGEEAGAGGDMSDPPASGTPVRLSVPVGADRLEVGGEVVWSVRKGPLLTYGVRVNDDDTMARVLREHGFDAGSSAWSRRMGALWRRPAVRRSVLFLWALSLLLVLLIPGLVRLLD